MATQTTDPKHLRAKSLIVNAMKQAGISTAVIEYSGSGDSGNVDDVTFTPEVDARVTIEDEDVSLNEAVRDFANELIDSEHSGYENDDGGSGTITINAETNLVTWEHLDYYTESDRSEYEL